MLWDGAERLERDFSFKMRDRIDLLFKVTLESMERRGETSA